MADKIEWFTIRLTPEFSHMMNELRAEYDIDNNRVLFRRMLAHVYQKRPALVNTLTPRGVQENTTVAQPSLCFRDLAVGTRFRLARFRRTVWVKTEPVREPGASIRYNAEDESGTRHTKIGWNAKVIVEER